MQRGLMFRLKRHHSAESPAPSSAETERLARRRALLSEGNSVLGFYGLHEKQKHILLPGMLLASLQTPAGKI